MNERAELARGWLPGTLLTVVLVGLLVLVSWLNLSGGDYRIPDTGVVFEARITLDGKPIPQAFVILQGESSMGQGYVGEDGMIRIESAPLGDVKIGINTDAARGHLMCEIMAAAQAPKKDGQKKAAPIIVDVPARYFDPGKSGISRTLVKGLNALTIELSKKP